MELFTEAILFWLLILHQRWAARGAGCTLALKIYEKVALTKMPCCLRHLCSFIFLNPWLRLAPPTFKRFLCSACLC